MNSDKRRREVAERLRNICYCEDDDGTYVCDGADIIEALCLEAADPFVADGFPCSEIERLADLIDRPTCKIRYDSVHIDYVCNRCGQHYGYPATSDGNGHPVEFKFCPTCGAEVVDHED